MTTAEIRDALNQTGVMYTRDNSDPGHIPGFWRSRILELCDALDAARPDIAELYRDEQGRHAITYQMLEDARKEILRLSQQLASEQAAHAKTDDDALEVRRLCEEALPRMQTLNNAMSSQWLHRAHRVLGV